MLGELSTLVRDLLLRRTAPEGGAALLSGGYDSATLDRLGKDVSAVRLIYLATTLQKTTADLYYSSNRRTDAELCLLRLCDESLSGDLTALEARVQRLEEGVARGQLIHGAVAKSGETAKLHREAPAPKAFREGTAGTPEESPVSGDASPGGG